MVPSDKNFKIEQKFNGILKEKTINHDNQESTDIFHEKDIQLIHISDRNLELHNSMEQHRFQF